MALETIGQNKPLTWKEFEEIVQADITHTKVQQAAVGNKCSHSDWIYRGQSNENWALDTSLERFVKREFNYNEEVYPLDDYYNYLRNAVPAINSLTSHKFDDFPPFGMKISLLGTIPEYRLICFARHHGFPAPTLDWSMSYYVAAFFAFRHA